MVTIQCESPYGRDTLTFNLTVPPAYTVELEAVPPGPFPIPQPVTLHGRVVFIDEQSPLLNEDVPVKLL